MGKSGSVSSGVTAPFSWLMVHTSFYLPSKCLFPQPCVSSGGSMVGLMETFYKRAYAIPRSAAPTASTPAVGLWWHVPLQKTLKLSKGGQAQYMWYLLYTQGFVWALWASLAGMGFDSKCDFAPPSVLLWLFLCLWTWGIFFWWDLRVWVNSGSWRWTGRAGVLWFMGSQRVGHDWATELNRTDWQCYTTLTCIWFWNEATANP